MRLFPLIISDWDSLMWACCFTGLISFIGGFWIAPLIWHPRTAQLGPMLEEGSAMEYSLPNRKTLLVAGLVLLIGSSVLAYEDILIGGIPIFADNADTLRMELFGGVAANPKFDTLSIKLIHPFVEFLKYGVFLAFIILFQKTPKTRKVVFLSILIILFGTLAYGSQAGRSFFVTIAVTGVVLFHYLRRRIRLIEIGAAVMALFLFLGLFGSWRIGQTQEAPVFERALANSDFPDGQFWESVAFGYVTVTISFEIFQRLIDDFQTMRHPPGGFLFYSLHRFIARTSLGAVAADLYSNESTTSTFLGDFYGDYGYWGVLFGPLVMGLLYGWAYSRGGGRNPTYWIYVRAFLLQMLIFFPYVNLFSLYLTWIFDLCCMYFLIRYLNRPKTLPLSPLPANSDFGFSPAPTARA
jgi:hypothetical protein